ncbi:hypothetical protein CFAM422_000085 [Trichoderma lentiforme]|uniref:Uncharacterized protein n=1 Tax=Trichoderma lentiforme TaxID=1567552 RepID=A0A9P4XNR8_9HYPO|nr:hypothetical protein CFAM422_000085 [Trichoderma lentiforme]
MGPRRGLLPWPGERPDGTGMACHQSSSSLYEKSSVLQSIAQPNPAIASRPQGHPPPAFDGQALGVSAARGTWTAQVSSNVERPSSKPPGPSSSVLFARIECAGEAIGMMPPLCVPALRKYESMYLILIYATVAAIKVGTWPVAAAPISIPSHGALFHLCAQPIRVPSQGVPPSQRRAAAAIVAKSPFQPARPVFKTLMRKRAASAYACIANPWPPPAPGATNHHRAFAVYPASRRPQMAHMAVTCACSIRVDRSVDDYVREIGGIEGRLVSKPSYSTRALAPWYTAPVVDGHTGSPVRASLFGLATALAPVAGVYRDREMASDPRSCPLLSSKWDKNPNRRLMSRNQNGGSKSPVSNSAMPRFVGRGQNCLDDVPQGHRLLSDPEGQ